ncbi:cell surface glycoprotein CD200 receptor 1-A-like [Pyrgilauda ruficollis]|uniref:cell surface glycoprotein CD200 receptor 1-A-like n=1 Tax=Pyrgilauda ruficollis TaxID=221976 RepID=UPI001B86FF21|nr:cell surface glycoprotein CD200 receptor 1-A-like [Pyrgilauda ruficollis]
MKAGTNMKIAGKTMYVFVLLITTMVMRLAGIKSFHTKTITQPKEKATCVFSKFTACSTSVTNVTTCMVSHPAGNWSQTIACCPSEKTNTNVFLYACIITCVLIIITLLAVIYYFTLHSDRPCHKTKPPEIAPIHSQQDDTMEVEPYTTYVQKENVIYNSVSDLTVGQNLPQDLCPGT